MPGSCLLTVRVLQAHGLPSKDLVTPSDCYVTLWLPTASSQRLQTRTVKNSRSPIWNQSFHFRIHSQLKNVVELRVFDQDLLTKDDAVLSVLFDVGTLRVGEFRRESFSLRAQGEERLEVEFRLQSLTEGAEQLASNGILVARELSCLHVHLTDMGDQKGESPAPMPLSDGPCRDLAQAALRGPQQSRGRGESAPGLLRAWAFSRSPLQRLGRGDAPPASAWAHPRAPQTRRGTLGQRAHSRPLSSGSCSQSRGAGFGWWFPEPVRVHRRPRWAPAPSASIAQPAGSRSSVFTCRMHPRSS